MRRILFPIFLLTVVGCGSDGAAGVGSLVNLSDEPAGSACEFGGVKVESGADDDADGNLTVTEVDKTSYVCNGPDAANPTLTRATAEPAGENCTDGGVRIDFGLDSDANGSLGDEEVQDTEFVCNGTDGMDGADGTNGVDGVDGTNGTSAVTPLVSVTTEPAGGACGTTAGVRIDAGPDTDADGVLDGTEVVNSEVVCNGTTGTNTAVVSNYDETGVNSAEGVDETLLSVTVNASGPGTVLVFGSADVYCSSTGAPACDGSGVTPAFLVVTDAASGDPTTSAGRSYAHLTDDTTENMATAGSFTVGAAGSYTYYLRGEAQFGNVSFWRRHLNAVFVGN